MDNVLSGLCLLPLMGCIALLFMYVLSLYVWQNTHLRNHPSVIKKRFLSVSITSVLSPFAIYMFSANDFPSKYNIFDLLGIRLPGVFMAATVPLLLTMILFLGPLTMQSQTDSWQLYSDGPQHNVSPSNASEINSKCVSSPLTDVHGINKSTSSLNLDNIGSPVANPSGPSVEDNSKATKARQTILPKPPSDSDGISAIDGVAPNGNKLSDGNDLNDTEPMYWLDSFEDLIWLRDHVVAPFSEELTFRACMLPLLLQCFRPHSAVFICPLFFGMAHFHHIYGRVKSGCSLRTAILVSGFQFLFTTMFGAYSAFLFLRTGHIIAPFMAHAFCNHIGFPNFREIWYYDEPKRSITSVLCIIGLISWCLLLEPLTNPSWYKNDIYWKL